MKPQLLTKNQVAAIVQNEFKANELHLHISAAMLIFIFLSNALFFLNDFSKILTLIFTMIEAINIYLLYKSNKAKVLSLQDKYVGE